MTKRWGDGKDRKYADMGLACFFQYRDEKGGLVSDLGMRNICDLLHSLAAILLKLRMAWQHISYRRLELVCDDGSNDGLVLDEFTVGRPTFRLGRYGAS